MGGGAVIVAGFGYRSGATVESLSDAYRRAGGGADVAATVADKVALVERLGLPVVALTPKALAAVQTVTRSEASMAARGVGSVAEAAALAAAGQGARLLAPRVISEDGRATCALAVGENK